MLKCRWPPLEFTDMDLDALFKNRNVAMFSIFDPLKDDGWNDSGLVSLIKRTEDYGHLLIRGHRLDGRIEKGLIILGLLDDDRSQMKDVRRIVIDHRSSIIIKEHNETHGKLYALDKIGIDVGPFQSDRLAGLYHLIRGPMLNVRIYQDRSALGLDDKLIIEY